MAIFPRALVRAALLLCLALPAAANQRLPEWTYDDVAQTLTFLDSSGSPVVLGTVNPSTHSIGLQVGAGGTATVPFGGTGQTSFTANLPLLGAGTAAIAQGTRSGNTTIFATSSGALTSGHCVSLDGSGNFVDAGGACTTGGGGGTVATGTISALAYYTSAGTTVSPLTTATSNVLTTGSGGIPAWASFLPCANEPSVSGDVAGASGSCSGRTVTGIQGVAVGTPTGTAGSGAVLATSPTITTPTLSSPTINTPTITSPTVTGAFTATGLVTNADLANNSMTINSVLCTLGGSCTVSSSGGAGSLTGTTLASNVVNSSLLNFATGPTLNQPVINGDTSAATNAAAGQVGEVLSATATAGMNTGGALINIVSKSITAGHWMCQAQLQATPTSNSISNAVVSINFVSSGSLGSAPFSAQTGGGVSGATSTANTGAWLFNTSTTVTANLVALANTPGGTGSISGTGFISCLRVW